MSTIDHDELIALLQPLYDQLARLAGETERIDDLLAKLTGLLALHDSAVQTHLAHLKERR